MTNENRTNQIGLIVASVLGLSLGAGTILNYLKTTRNEIVRNASERIPVSFDLERLKILSNDLLPHIVRHQQSAERLRLSILGIEKQIRDTEAKQKTAKDEMAALRHSLEAGQPELKYGGKAYSRQDVADDLKRRLNVYEREEKSLEERREHIAQLRHLFDKSTLAIEALSERQHLLINQHDRLKAKLLAADLELTSLPSSETAIDFTTAEELAKEIETKIAGRFALVSTDKAGRIPVDLGPSPEDRYDSLFTSGTADQ